MYGREIDVVVVVYSDLFVCVDVVLVDDGVK